MLKFATVLFAVLLVSGCEAPQSATGTERPAEIPFTPERLVSRTTVKPYPQAVTARLFVQNGRGVDGAPAYVAPDGRRLTDPERQAVEATLSLGSYTAASAEAACFVPHHFVRYYDAAGAQVGEIAICFCCAGVQATPDITGPVAEGADYTRLDFDFEALKAVFQRMDIGIDFGCELDDL